MHLIIDGYCTHKELLRDESQLKLWMLDIAEILSFHTFGKPQIVDYPFPDREGTALSATLFLGESSMTIHTYPEFNFIFIDIFHCQNFDAHKALNWIKESLGLYSLSSFLFERGLDSTTGKPLITRPLAWSGII